MTGAVRSMWMPPTVSDPTLSALSFAWPEAPSEVPSPVIVLSSGHEANPESVSLHTQWTTTSELYQPAFGAGTSPWMDGAVRSTSMLLTVVDLLLSAMSTAVPVTDWFSPSTSVVAPTQLPMPDNPSAQVNDTPTGCDATRRSWVPR